MKKIIAFLITMLLVVSAFAQKPGNHDIARFTQHSGYIYADGSNWVTSTVDTIMIDTIRSRTNNADLFLYGRGAGGVNIEGAYTLPGADGTSGYLISTNGAGVWGYTDPSSITPSGAALTKNDDTNVTLTLGGTPTTALLQATSLTLGWTGNLSVARGGSGAGTFTDGGILYGNGTSAFSVTSAPAGADEFLVSTGAGTWGLESATSARTSLGLGTMATQNANSVNIDGGTIDGTPIAGSTGSFTTVNASGIVEIGGSGFGTSQELTVGGSGFQETALFRDINTNGTGIGRLSFYGDNSSGTPTIYAGVRGQIVTNTAGTESGQVTIEADVAGSFTTHATFQGGNTEISGTLTSGAITSTALTGTGDDIVYATSGGALTRSTVDINDISTGGIQTSEVTISSANFLNINSSPVTIVSAPGAGNYIVIMAFAASMDYNSTTYSCSGNLRLEYATSGVGTEVPASTYCSGSDQAAMNVVQQASGLAIGINQALVAKTASSDPTTGNSPIKIKVWYTIESI